MGRAFIHLPLARPVMVPGADRVTIAVLDGEVLTIVPLDPATRVAGERVAVADTADGPACLLVHEESDDLADLRQLALHGVVRGGVLHVERRTGSLEPSHPDTLQQLRTLRSLGQAARRNLPVLERWARGDPAGTAGPAPEGAALPGDGAAASETPTGGEG